MAVNIGSTFRIIVTVKGSSKINIFQTHEHFKYPSKFVVPKVSVFPLYLNLTTCFLEVLQIYQSIRIGA